MNKKKSQGYVRCFWAGRIQLLNGDYLPLYCTHISKKQVEVEISTSLVDSPKVMLELNAFNNGKTRNIKAICSMDLVFINKHDNNYIKLVFKSISQEDISFIEQFIIDHS